MSFKIFAVGKISNGESITVVKDNCPDDDSFDVGVLTSALHLMAGDPAAAIEAQVPNEGAAYVEAYKGLAKIESAHNLVTAVNYLQLESAAANGKIKVACLEKNLLLPNKSAAADFVFTGNNSGADFMRKLLPVLEETNMNNYGVLMQLWLFISKVARKIGPNVQPHIVITLDR
jgi:hypothetical protein